MKIISVDKYGGAFFVSPETIRSFGPFWYRKIKKGKRIFIVSARKGITRLLRLVVQNKIDEANAPKSKREFSEEVVEMALEKFQREHLDIISGLFLGNDLNIAKEHFGELSNNLKMHVQSFETGVERKDFYSSTLKFGELTISAILSRYLNSIGIRSACIDSRDYLTTTSYYKNARIVEMDSSFIELFNGVEVIVAPGFIGRSREGNDTLLGFDGSDLSASYFAGGAVDAGYKTSITFWKDVSKIYMEDPFINTQAEGFLKMKFSEYKKLSSHPIRLDAVKYALAKNIPVEMGCFLNPFAEKAKIIKG